MTKWDDLISDEDLKKVASIKKKDKIRKTIKKGEIQDYLDNEWNIVKNNKSGSAVMETKKKIGDAFEDEVWSIFYKMGFKTMNGSHDFEVSYSKNNPNLTKQLDVVAIDDEVVVIVECKEAEKMTQGNWKKELESIHGYKDDVIKELRTKYPNKKYIYIFATKNFIIGPQDRDRMKEFNIENFEYDTVQYYDQLANHLGSSARYQFLASIFSNQKIKGMDNRVPAIQGKMGGLTYYSFSIEPEKLLKIAYVLHRNNANRDNMPTYQRIIKKDRLNAVRNYINAGGYFPNSLIISIDTKGRGVQFDQSSLQVEDSISKIGVLHLPQTYQAAYVIDGQHRLYGYSDTQYASTNTVPVVAFVDLDKQSQVKMFMDINENQKSVSKGLRNTLNIDMLWDSKKCIERNKALMLDIGQKLCEDKKSALYDRIITGENPTTKLRCITLEYVRDALSKSSFFNEYKKNDELIKAGTFAKNTNEETEKIFLPFINDYFNTIKNNCEDEWDKGSDGYLAINTTVYALIKILDDIVNIWLKKLNKSIVTDNKQMFNSIKNMVDDLCITLSSLNDDEIKTIKSTRGEGAKNTAWRTIQVAFHNNNPEFTNDDIENYIKEKCNNYRDDILVPFDDLKKGIFDLIKNELEEYGDWYNDLISNEIQKNLHMKRSDLSFDRHSPVEDISIWEVISFKELIDIIQYGRNWSLYIQKLFSDEENGVKTHKEELINDLKDLQSIDFKINSNAKILNKDLILINNLTNKYNNFVEK